MTNQIIRRFQITGRTLGAGLPKTRETLRVTLLSMMKDEGFTPLFDLDPMWEMQWLGDDLYDFTYTWQGVYVGKESAWQTEGVLGGKRITSTPKIK